MRIIIYPKLILGGILALAPSGAWGDHDLTSLRLSNGEVRSMLRLSSENKGRSAGDPNRYCAGPAPATSGRFCMAFSRPNDDSAQNALNGSKPYETSATQLSFQVSPVPGEKKVKIDLEAKIFMTTGVAAGAVGEYALQDIKNPLLNIDLSQADDAAKGATNGKAFERTKDLKGRVRDITHDYETDKGAAWAAAIPLGEIDLTQNGGTFTITGISAVKSLQDEKIARDAEIGIGQRIEWKVEVKNGEVQQITANLSEKGKAFPIKSMETNIPGVEVALAGGYGSKPAAANGAPETVGRGK